MKPANDLKLPISLLVAAVSCLALSAPAQDWPQWGGTPARNMFSPSRDIPHQFTRDKKSSVNFKQGTEEIDRSNMQNLKWVAKLGSQSYGNVTISKGKVFIGTNNENPRDPASRGGPQHPDVLRRENRRAALAARHSQAGLRQGQRLGRPGIALLADHRGRPRLHRQQPLRGALPGHQRHGQRQRRPLQGRGQVRRQRRNPRQRQADRASGSARRARPEGRRHHLALRHDR